MRLEKLFELQQLESKLKAVANQLAALTKDAELKRYKEEYKKLKAIYDREESMHKSNMAQLEAKNNEIKNLNSKKLDGMERHLEKIYEKLELAEKNIIKLSEEGKNIEKDIDEIKKKMSFIKRKYLSLKEIQEKSLNELNEEKTALEIELAKAQGEIADKPDSELMEIYEKMKKRYEDPVSEAISRRCTGCNVEIPAMEYEALKSGKGIIRCESCGRLLLLRKR